MFVNELLSLQIQSFVDCSQLLSLVACLRLVSLNLYLLPFHSCFELLVFVFEVEEVVVKRTLEHLVFRLQIVVGLLDLVDLASNLFKFSFDGRNHVILVILACLLRALDFLRLLLHLRLQLLYFLVLQVHRGQSLQQLFIFVPD